MTASITLSAGAWTAQIGPDLGGALLSLSRDGEPILRPTPASAVETGDVLLTAGYPMMPYANRIDQGRFRFAGADYHLTTGALGAPHSLHGLAWRRAWAIDSRSAGACTLSLGHHPAGADDPDWPFAFGASQRFIQIFANRQRLGQNMVTIDSKRRDQPLWVQAKVFRTAMRLRAQRIADL